MLKFFYAAVYYRPEYRNECVPLCYPQIIMKLVDQRVIVPYGVGWYYYYDRLQGEREIFASRYDFYD